MKRAQEKKEKNAALLLGENKEDANKKLAPLLVDTSDLDDSDASEHETSRPPRPRLNRSPRSPTPSQRSERMEDLYPVGSACLFFSTQLHRGSPPCDEVVVGSDGETSLCAWHLAIIDVQHVTEVDGEKCVAIMLWTGKKILAYAIDLLPLIDFYDAEEHYLTFGRHALFPDLCKQYGEDGQYVPVEFAKLPVLHAKYNITPAEADEW